MKRSVLLAAALLLAACNPLSNTLTLPAEPGAQSFAGPGVTAPTAAPADGRVTGETKNFLNQNVTSWAKVQGDKIEEAGFTLPLALVEATSTDKASQPFSIKLEMPDTVQSKTVIDHVSIDYIAGGHPPPGVYDAAHFDVHFYFNSQSTQAAVDCKDKTLPAADRQATPFILPPAGPNTTEPECVPTMGYHAIDPRSPELAPQNPAKFDKTMIMGYYNGKLNFIEPMVTREFLLKKQGFSFDIVKPAVVDKAGQYPAKAELRFNAANNSYELVLKEFK